MPTALLLTDMQARGAPLEYWFVKFHTGGLAFLVDLIVRAPHERAEVRVSMWVRGQGRVIHHYPGDWHAAEDGIVVGDSRITASGSIGAAEDVAWDLRHDPGAERAAPTIPLLGRLRPLDMDLVSRPRTRFTGHVTVAGERFPVEGAPGCLTHYWGRRLPDRWIWISATDYPDTDLAVEAVLLRSRLWGARPGLPAGYLWTNRTGTLISPLTGLLTRTGDAREYVLRARTPGRTVSLACSAPAEAFNDLGEGIHQTLHGRCQVSVNGSAPLTDEQAGLEFRQPA